MKTFILFSILTLTFSAQAGVLKRAQNDKKTTESLSQCKAAVKIIDAEIPDTVACPKVVKYTFKEAMSATELKAVVEVELKFSLESKTAEWKTIMAESFDLQTGFAAETLSEGSGQYTDKVEKKIRKAIKDADSSVAGLSKGLELKGNALGSKIFLDTNTSWAPKIKAKAILILNAPHKTVEVYLHGDLDG